ncbi:MAG: cupin-like domain-containing protein [Cyanobacteria bacterium HKST-UBA05]|nr:cupin-like domain-containing protein [Cyanobacteria bacterium HKST-UBA05]
MLDRLLTPTITPDWQEWMADCLMMQVAREDIEAFMVAQGFGQRQVQRHLLAMETHPFVLAGTKIARKMKRRDWLLDTYQRVMEQSGEFDEIEVRDTIDRQTFYKHYFAVNRPVILKQQVKDWQILKRWTPQYFKTAYGDRQVQMVRMTEDFHRYHHHCTMAEFVDVIESGPANDWYMSNANIEHNDETLDDLFHETDKLPELLDPEGFRNHGYVLLGPAGTITDLHYDLANAFYVQIYGRKSFKVISPHYLDKVYPYRNFLSRVPLEDGVEGVDAQKFPLFKQAKVHEFVLEPGDAFFLPVGWWHWVEALDTSISMSFPNFYTLQRYQQYWDIAGRHPLIDD